MDHSQFEIEIKIVYFYSNWSIRGGSVRPNLEGQIIKNWKAENKKTRRPNGKAEFDHKGKNLTNIIHTKYIYVNVLGQYYTCSLFFYGLVVKFSLSVWPSVFFFFGFPVFIFSAFRITHLDSTPIILINFD